MVQLNSKDNVILPSWMPFISKTHQIIITTDECTNESTPCENENSNNIFTVKDFLNTLAFSDNLMLNHLKDQIGNKTNVQTLNLKNNLMENFWNWTLRICWFIRNKYLNEFNLDAMMNCENEIIKDNHNNNNSIIHLSTSELTTLINGNNYPVDNSLKEKNEYIILLDILNLHHNLCLELSSIEKGDKTDNEKSIFFLWWFMSYNLLKLLNKKIFIYEEQEFDKMMKDDALNNSVHTINVAYATHSGYDYFSEDMLSFSKYYLQSLENNVLLLFQEEEEEGERDCKYQQDLLNKVFSNKVKCIPMTFNSFSSMMQESDFFKEKVILDSIKTAKNIDEFTITKQLGTGSSGFVRNAIHVKTGRKVIIKYVVKSLILRGCWTTSSDNIYKRFPNEITVLQYIHDKYNGNVPNNLTTLITYWEDSMYYYLVFADTAEFDLDLFDYLDKTPKRMMAENEAKIIFKNIAEAIQILHHNNIVHRDIKDENVLINTNTKKIQLIDFGSSAFYKNDQKLRNFVGSFLFAAPEIIKGMTYDGPPQDIWSLGILLYTMIFKVTPFGDYYEILRKKMIFPQSISKECMELILWMTNRNISQRPTIDQVLEHKWLN